jgi:hypothetical protein
MLLRRGSAYAKQAKDDELISFATEIKLRAERRAGELLATMPKAKGGGDTSTGSRAQPVQEPPTLADLGVTKTQSSKWQKLAALPEDKFEARVNIAKGKAANATTKRASTPRRNGPSPTSPVSTGWTPAHASTSSDGNP